MGKIIDSVRGRLARMLSTWSMSLSEDAVVSYLRDCHLEFFVRNFNSPIKFSLSEIKFNGNQPKNFLDLMPLFFPTPLTRGIARLDIDEAMFLFETISELANPRGMEIGRLNGGSTILISVAVGRGGHLTSIDLAPVHDDGLMKVLNEIETDQRVDLIVGDANEVEIEGDLDFVFIDGDHTFEGARRDHNRWARRVKPGGYVIHHDMSNARSYSTQWDSLKELRDAILQQQTSIFTVTSEVGSLIVLQRKEAEWQPVE